MKLDHWSDRKLGLTVLIALPLLLLLQLHLPRPDYPPYRPAATEQALDDYTAMTENANLGNPQAIAKLAQISFARRQPELGLAYLRLGALQFEQPSLQLWYGDICRQNGDVKQARLAYSLALIRARKDRQADFAAIAAKRLEDCR